MHYGGLQNVHTRRVTQSHPSIISVSEPTPPTHTQTPPRNPLAPYLGSKLHGLQEYIAQLQPYEPHKALCAGAQLHSLEPLLTFLDRARQPAHDPFLRRRQVLQKQQLRKGGLRHCSEK